jgi:nicotinate-nucleotide adenylyltransferase
VSKRIGILGGAFDPIHYGHLLLASEATHQLKLNLAVFVPTFISAHKNKRIRTPFTDRFAMVAAAVADVRSFVVSDIESGLSGRSYTVNTLKELRKHYRKDEFFFLIGADNVEQLRTWHKPEELTQLATLAVASRPGYSPKLPDLPNVVTFEMPLLEISASDIRSRVKQGIPIAYMVPPVVEKYIKKRGLYRGQ